MPKWSQTLLALMLGLTFGVVFPTVDSGTDISLGGGLIRNGHLHWGLLILFPVGLNTVFVLINCIKDKKLCLLFAIPLILLQVYPQSIALSNMYRLVTGKTDLEQYRRDTISFEGGLGSIEPFIESVPQTFIQTGFFVLASHMSTIFERFCYNDVKEPCNDFFNCTPCHITLADPSCARVQYVEPFNCHPTDLGELITNLRIKTEYELHNCSELRSDCEEQFQYCLEPFFACISNCTTDLRLKTLSQYDDYEERIGHLMSYQGNESWKHTYWHERYQATLDDMERIQLFLYFIGTNFWFGFFSLMISFFSATYGITKFFKNSHSRFVESFDRYWLFCLCYTALFLLLKSLALASLLMDAYRLPLESILWWTGFCVLPQMIYATILVTWDALLVSPSKFLSLPLKVPPLVMGPAITPFTYTTVQTVHETDVEPNDSERNFKRFQKKQIRPKISAIHSTINFAVTSILASVVVLAKAGGHTHWLIFGGTVLVLFTILAIPFFLILRTLEKKSDELNANCQKHDKKACETCDDQFTFNQSRHFVDNECSIHGSSYPCKICRAIQNSVCSRSETNQPAKQRAYFCRTCNNFFGPLDEIYAAYMNICETCKEVCHKNHEVEFYCIGTVVCDCNTEMKCSLFYCKKHPKLQVKCIACNFKGAVATKKGTNLCTRMRGPEELDEERDCYTCHTCKIEARICTTCVQQCHRRHNTDFAGKFKRQCACGQKQNQSADLCIFVCWKNPQHPFIKDPPTGCTACLSLDKCFQNKQCTILVTSNQDLDNFENKYQCQKCDNEVVCQTCKNFCHQHQEAIVDIEDDLEVYQEIIGNSEDNILEAGFYCKCGAGELESACKAPNKTRQKMSMIQKNNFIHEIYLESYDDEIYRMLYEDDIYETVETVEDIHAEEDLYQPLEDIHAEKDLYQPLEDIHAEKDLYQPLEDIHAEKDLYHPLVDIHAEEDLDESLTEIDDGEADDGHRKYTRTSRQQYIDQ